MDSAEIPCIPLPLPGMIMVDGGEGEVDDTLETVSGETVTLSCALDQLPSDDSSVTFTWTRQDGRELPEGSQQTGGGGGVCECFIVMIS